MRKQHSVWEEEHKKINVLPSMASDKPNSGVVLFVKYLKTKIKPQVRCIDIGCGKGRNAIYLAQQGFEVYGIDYVKSSIEHAKKAASNNDVSSRLILTKAFMDRKWPFKDNFFDVAIDCFASIDVETKKGRETYKKEMLRTLKPGGYVLVMAVAAEDEIESELIRTSPGKERNSTIWPGGKFQKDYDENELREFYDEFEIMKVRKIKKPAFKLNRNYTATNYWMVLRKSAKSKI